MCRNFRLRILSILLICGSCFSATAANSLAFFDGSASEDNYTVPAVTRGVPDQVLGRVFISGTAPGVFTETSITLNGSHTGLSGFRFWISTDQTFGSDIQFGSTVATDPGATALHFSGTGNLTNANTWLFLTADVSGTATGTVQADVVAWVSSELDASTFNNGGPNPMSNASVPLPVTLSKFKIE